MIIKKFEQTVQRFAKETAIVTDNGQLTYEEVNKQANNLARAVSGPGSIPVKIDQPEIVGLLFEHSTDMIVSVLGTLKAGKSYLPLDITYPESRLVYMLENCEAGLVLTNTKNMSLAEKLAEKVENKIKILNIDSIDLNNNSGSENIERDSSGDKMAYILFTSGSTGQPKGVMQTHENVCYYIKNWTHRFSITHADRMTLFTAFSHDGAGQDMFGALHNGAVLYPYSILNKPNIHELIDWLNREKITIWHSVPTIYRYFVNTLEERELKPGHFPHLRFILLGGEQIRDHDIRIFKRFFPGAVFANVYGQTESSVNSIWLVRPGDLVNKMLIGEPLDKTEILIVDDEGEIVEGMGIGEIVIACKHLSPGYWKNIEASKEKFFNLPELGPIYRTGDLGRLMADGSIECMGRKDAQVKIRGFRIETGEIETRLLQHPAVKEVVVMVRQDEENNDYICAYYTIAPSTAEREITVSQLRGYLSGEIPDYMVPSHFVRLEKIPVTPNGKVDRKSLPEPEHTRPQLDANYVAPGIPIEKQVSEAWKDVLKLDKVGIDDNFFDLGGTSFDIIKIMGRLYEVFKKDIPVVSIFRYPTVRSFVRYLSGEETGAIELRDRVISRDKEGITHEPIAVVGMSCRFPGSKNLDEFWENLKNGVESISHFTDEELADEGAEPVFLNNPNFVKSKGIVGDVDYFDAAFFNYSPTEAQVMDPQLRLLHECSWEALENAGYDPESYAGLIGLYAGNANNSYWLTLIHMNRVSTVDTGFLINNYSTIVSYKLNLRGPSFVVQSACSTSLVAIHLACRGLMDHECDIALAGGVSILFPDKNGYMYQEGMILSPDGHCRTFDAKAGGTVFGNGAGIVTLKRLADAEADGDTIHAVILGTGINNDGKRKVGLSSPSVDGQAEVIANVYHQSGIDPETVGYLEAHGTATPLGDPVELEALNLAFNTDKRAFCKIGSVKSNVGHLNVAAGIAGIIKVVLTLENKMIPPSLHFETPNPKIDFKNSPFVVNTGLTEWKREQFPLRAAVSSFGIGGTNAHIVLEEAPVAKPSAADGRPLKMLLLSAASRAALRQASENLGNFLVQNPGVNLADIAYTLQVGRKACKLRKMILCSTVEEAVEHLLSPEEPLTPETGKVHISATDEDNKPIVFMFSGQGAQYVDMGLELYRTEPVFRAEMDRCFALLAPLMDNDLKEIIFRSDSSHRSNETYESCEEKINSTGITQPLLFVFEYSLARLLIAWGFTPYAMIGHSIGEYTAACLSGVFSLEDALKVVAARGRLMQRMPGGSMLGVPLPEEEVLPLLTGELSLAAVNTHDGCVVSGPHGAVDSLERELTGRGLNCRRLHTSHAFHSAMMDPILDEFEKTVAGVKRKQPTIPYISNISGNWITVEDAVDPAYWSGHLRGTVRFADGLSRLFTLLKDSDALFLEVGPGRTLSTFVRQHRDKQPGHTNLNLIRHPKETVSDSHHLLSRIGQLWLEGKKIDWRGFYSGEKRHRVPLPTYPFQKQRYFLKGDPYKLGTPAPSSSREWPAGKRPDITDWFYIPSWKTSVVPPRRGRKPVARETSNWLLFIEDDKRETSIGQQLRKELTDAGHGVVSVRAADRFSRVGDNEYTVNPAEEGDYRTLLAHCAEKGKIPRQIVHLWNLSEVSDNREHRELAFYSLLYLARAVGMENTKENIRLTVVTDRMQSVTGEEIVEPQKATINGILQVIPREYPNLECRSIDIDMTGPQPDAGVLANELLSGGADEFIAFRDRYRWVRSFEPMPLEKSADPVPGLKEGGVYLVTGGLGGIGLVLAEYLAKTLKAKLILTGRTPLHDSTSDKKQKVRDMEANGAEVLVMGADVSDRLRMREVIDRARERFGMIDGVIHAAGIADGGLIQVRTKELSERVFAPKIDGTLILDDLLKDSPPDFFILCSSVSAVTGTLGQAAYSAANAFMDSFAYYKSAKDKNLTLSIDWDAWQEVGMALEAVKQFTRSTRPGAPAVSNVDYPFFDRCETAGPHQSVYVSYLQSGNCWFLDEHCVMGKAVLPGTAYLEMARAAVEHYLKSGSIELSEFYVLAPFIVERDEEKEMRIVVNKDRTGAGCSFSFIGRVAGGEDAWVEHAGGKAAPLVSTEKEPKRFDLKTIEEVCGERETRFHIEEYNGEQGAVNFGPRWNNLREVKIGSRQALAFLELPGEYVDEDGTYKLHPALLDVGNIVLKRHEGHEGTYVPAFYKRLTVKGAMPTKVYFHVRGINGNRPGAETLQYDISVMDEMGVEWVDIEAYTLRKVNPGARTAQQFNRRGEDAPLPLSSFVTAEEESRVSVSHLLKDAISPAEGIDVFLRVLGEAGVPQVIVSATHLEPRLKRVAAITPEGESEGHAELARSAPKLARPELSTDYAAPVTETEKALAPIWEELLGIREVGIYDDFFELGGDSLKAVNFGSRIHKALNTEVPVSEFFNKPTIKELARYIDGSGEKSRFHSIEPAEEKEYYALSSAQKRMFILQQLERDSLGYNLPSVFLVDGNPDMKRFEKALAQTIERHESFRTSFSVIDGKPVQRVHPARDVAAAVEYYDTADYSDSPESKILSGFVRPFDLSRPPLLRIGLVRLGETRFLFLADAHHIIFDGMSNLIFFKEFMGIYAGKSLAPLHLQYKDYSEWRNLPENVIARQDQEKYWIDLFSKKIPILNLPSDFQRPAAQSFEGKRLTFTFDHEKTEALKTMATKREQTLYMLLLAVINVLLMKLSGQEDIVVGTPVAGRKHADLHQVIGVFINTLALRNFPAGEKTFDTFLEEVKTSTLKAFENQDCQFEELLDKVDVRRDAGRNPLFDVMFRMQNFELPDGGIMEMEIDGLKLTEYGHDPNKSMLDLSFTVVELNKRLVFFVEFCTKLFKTETVQRMIYYFGTIVHIVLENPRVPLSGIEIVTGEEKQRLLFEFNNTDADFPKEKTIHRLFEERAATMEHEVAVTGNGFPTLTYRELNEQAGVLARRLREKGVTAGTIAAVLLKRTPAVMVGLLGILKTGAAYLPLDPEHPEARINYILEKSGARYIVTHEYLNAGTVFPGFEGEIVDISDNTLFVGTGADENPIDSRDLRSADRPAYVIYTSGSTGNPKGVLVHHRNAVNFIEGMAAVIDFSPGKTILALTTISFDIFFLETLLPVTRGMKMVVADEEQQKDPARLKSLILENRVDIMQVTPSRLQLMLDPQAGGNFPSCVGELLVGGEAFPAHLFGLLKENFYGRVYNVYGPTETTVWSTVKDLTGCRPEEMTIGRPIANTRVYIVDSNFHLQPVGVAGELLIGGEGVAAGYLNNVELTAEKFTAFYGFDGSNRSYRTYSTIYRTGDLARWLPDGEIEFMGRLDHQVKIRGFRIELEEIEEQLLKHENIKDAVVTARTGRNNEKYLCAYFVPRKIDENGGNGFSSTDLRDRLSAKLPPYMIPSHFVQLDSIPLTPNGKIDRKSLPEPDASRTNSGATYIAPRTGNELIIAQLWKEILQMDEVGIHDNFFDLGGNSMNAIQLNWKLKETFGKEIPVALMFRNLSISFLDGYLSGVPEDRGAGREIPRAEALNKAQKTYKNTIAKLTANRRTT